MSHLDPIAPDWELVDVRWDDSGAVCAVRDPDDDTTQSYYLSVGAIVGLGRRGPALYDGKPRTTNTDPK